MLEGNSRVGWPEIDIPALKSFSTWDFLLLFFPCFFSFVLVSNALRYMGVEKKGGNVCLGAEK